MEQRHRDRVIDAALDQIRVDVENADMTAIQSLLDRVETRWLEGFLPEETLANITEN